VKRNRTSDLSRSTDLLSKRVYALTREAVRAEAGVKELKELCALLKDTISAAGALEKQAEEGAGTLLVTFDAGIADFAE
jgi:hypothetical protein